MRLYQLQMGYIKRLTLHLSQLNFVWYRRLQEALGMGDAGRRTCRIRYKRVNSPNQCGTNWKSGLPGGDFWGNREHDAAGPSFRLARLKNKLPTS